VLFTANNDVQLMLNASVRSAHPLSVNLFMGYRKDRIEQILQSKDTHTVADMKALVYDALLPWFSLISPHSPRSSS